MTFQLFDRMYDGEVVPELLQYVSDTFAKNRATPLTFIHEAPHAVSFSAWIGGSGIPLRQPFNVTGMALLLFFPKHEPVLFQRGDDPIKIPEGNCSGIEFRIRAPQRA